MRRRERVNGEQTAHPRTGSQQSAAPQHWKKRSWDRMEVGRGLLLHLVCPRSSAAVQEVRAEEEEEQVERPSRR